MHGERADDRHRHRQQRNDRGAPGLQEQDHHQHHQHHRFEQRVHHRLDRGADELRRVVDDAGSPCPRACSRFSSSMVLRTLSEISSALEPGDWKTRSPTAGLLSSSERSE